MDTIDGFNVDVRLGILQFYDEVLKNKLIVLTHFIAHDVILVQKIEAKLIFLALTVD